MRLVWKPLQNNYETRSFWGFTCMLLTGLLKAACQMLPCHGLSILPNPSLPHTICIFQMRKLGSREDKQLGRQCSDDMRDRPARIGSFPGPVYCCSNTNTLLLFHFSQGSRWQRQAEVRGVCQLWSPTLGQSVYTKAQMYDKSFRICYFLHQQSLAFPEGTTAGFLE